MDGCCSRCSNLTRARVCAETMLNIKHDPGIVGTCFKRNDLASLKDGTRPGTRRNSTRGCGCIVASAVKATGSLLREAVEKMPDFRFRRLWSAWRQCCPLDVKATEQE